MSDSYLQSTALADYKPPLHSIAAQQCRLKPKGCTQSRFSFRALNCLKKRIIADAIKHRKLRTAKGKLL